jgi:hypothetical protein
MRYFGNSTQQNLWEKGLFHSSPHSISSYFAISCRLKPSKVMGLHNSLNQRRRINHVTQKGNANQMFNVTSFFPPRHVFKIIETFSWSQHFLFWFHAALETRPVQPQTKENADKKRFVFQMLYCCLESDFIWVILSFLWSFSCLVFLMTVFVWEGNLLGLSLEKKSLLKTTLIQRGLFWHGPESCIVSVHKCLFEWY